MSEQTIETYQIAPSIAKLRIQRDNRVIEALLKQPTTLFNQPTLPNALFDIYNQTLTSRDSLEETEYHSDLHQLIRYIQTGETFRFTIQDHWEALKNYLKVYPFLREYFDIDAFPTTGSALLYQFKKHRPEWFELYWEYELKPLIPALIRPYVSLELDNDTKLATFYLRLTEEQADRYKDLTINFLWSLETLGLKSPSRNVHDSQDYYLPQVISRDHELLYADKEDMTGLFYRFTRGIRSVYKKDYRNGQKLTYEIEEDMETFPYRVRLPKPMIFEYLFQQQSGDLVRRHLHGSDYGSVESQQYVDASHDDNKLVNILYKILNNQVKLVLEVNG